MNNKGFAGPGLAPSYLLTKVWGEVTYVDPSGSFMYVNDGSGVNDGNANGYVGVRVILSDTTSAITAPVAGAKLAVTGIYSFAYDGSKTLPVIRPRGAADLQQ